MADLLDYMVPTLKWDDLEQFHTECSDTTFDFAGNVVTSGYGGCFKTRLAPSGPDGELRIINMKGVHYPSEYLCVKVIDGVRRLFLETEGMDGIGNASFRDYHDPATGFPTFEWARGDAQEGVFYTQGPFVTKWYYCGDKPDIIEPPPAYPMGYIIKFFDLADIPASNVHLADIGPIDPTWPEFAAKLGTSTKAVVLASHWGNVSNVIKSDPSLWYHRELYFYLFGGYFLGWYWQVHPASDPTKPFCTTHTTVQKGIVKEWDAILPLAMCQRPPVSAIKTGQEVKRPISRFNI
jgi:hypothetical protein